MIITKTPVDTILGKKPKDIRANELISKVLVEPFQEYKELNIVSGYATPSMIQQQLDLLKNIFNRNDIKLNLIVGMTPLGISMANHKNFIKMSSRENISCSYQQSTFNPVHSKLYVWGNNGKPEKAFIASANYSVNAFLRQQGEIASECNPESALDYYNFMVGSSVYCEHPDSELLLLSERKRLKQAELEGDMLSDEEKEGKTAYLPLFSERRKEIQNSSGLNWGQRPEHNREPNQAYIPVPSRITKSGFFPPRGQQFSVITSDGFPFICRICQDGGKALESENNSDLGRYFRKRLGVPEGKRVKLKDLDDFGNRYVAFHKISDEEYLMEYEPAPPPNYQVWKNKK